MVALYRLPFAIGFREECAGASVATTIAGLRGRVLLPQIRWYDYGPRVCAPESRGFTQQMATTEWGQVSCWNQNSKKVYEWWANAIVLRFFPLPTEHFSYSAYLYGRGAPHGEPVVRLFEAIDRWSGALAKWLEVLVDQDVGRLGPVARGSIQGAGLRVWTREGSVESLATSSWRTTVIVRREELVDIPTWRKILRLVQQERSVPHERILLADARGWLRRGEYRRAVIDAGTVAELSMTRLLVQALQGVPEPVRGKLQEQRLPLGTLVRLLGPSLNVAEAELNSLVSSRNKAAHRNADLSKDDGVVALRAATLLAEMVEPLGRFR